MNTCATPIRSAATGPSSVEEMDEDWYEATFGGSGSPTFSDYARAHLIERTQRLSEDDLEEAENDQILAIHLDDNHVVLFTHNSLEIKRGVEVLAVSGYLYDNKEAQGGPVASMVTYVISARTGNEADVFAAIDCDWADIADALFLPFQEHPATFTRMFALGMVGYSKLMIRSDATPAYKLKLHRTIVDAVLPAMGAKPYVMLYDTTPPGYRMPLDMMAGDLEQLAHPERIKALALLELRHADEDNYTGWLRSKLNAAPLAETLLSMAVLNEHAYSEEVLFAFSMETGDFTPSIPEPREEPVEYEDYAEGNYEPITVY